MAILPILCYRDPRLHKVAKPVEGVDERVRAILDDMLATMYDANGIGLAATQINVHERVVVIDTSEERNDPLVLIKLIQGQPNRYKFEGATLFKFQVPMERPEERFNTLEALLERLAPPSA